MSPGGAPDAAVAWLAGAETPSGELQPWDVSPGIEGFFAFFALAAVIVVLGVLVVRTMRRVDQNARVRAAQEAADRRDRGPDEAGSGPVADGSDPGPGPAGQSDDASGPAGGAER